MSAIKRFRIQVRGKVQGVYYRQSAKSEAEVLDLTGFVRNETDGSVYIEAQGNETQLAAFISWCRKGPRFAQVVSLEQNEIPPASETGFRVFR